MLGVKGFGITKEFACHHRTTRGRNHKARDLKEVTDCMVDVAAFLATPASIEFRLAGSV